MEAKTRKPVLGFDGTLARLAPAALCALALAAAGCGGRASTREPSAAPTLADVLERMPAQAQLDTLRALTLAAPDDARLAFHTGNAYYALAGEQSPEHQDRALVYFDSATVAYRRATAIDPDYSRAFVNMGLALDASRKWGEARAAYQRAIAIDPDDVLAYCHLGYLEYNSGNRSEAMRLYQRAIAIDPGSAQAHYNLGLAFAEARIFREALGEWERVMELDPDGELGRTAADNVRIIRQYLAETP